MRVGWWIVFLAVGVVLCSFFLQSSCDNNTAPQPRVTQHSSSSTTSKVAPLSTQQSNNNNYNFSEYRQMMNHNTKLHVKGLPSNISSKQVSKVFSIFGELENAFAIYDFTTKERKGEAYIQYKFEASAQRAISTLDGAIYQGNTLSVSHIQQKHKTIVVGSGLAACCAANEALKAGSFVIMLEKDSTFGGNSAKASSGINAALNDEDIEVFYQDTLKSSEGLSDPTILRRFIVNSQSNIQYLENELEIELDQVVKLGGHSAARTFRNSVNDTTNIGYLLISKFREKLRSHPNFLLQHNATVKQLLIDPVKQSVRGVSVLFNSLHVDDDDHSSHNNIINNNSSNGNISGNGSGSNNNIDEVKIKEEEGEEEEGALVSLIADAVVLATGGYSQNKKILNEVAPYLQAYPSTNKLTTTGDGILLSQQIGAKVVQMEQIQLHPTGFVHPDDPNNAVKVLAPEALRGYGSILLNQKGDRFVNELGLRKYVSEAISANCENHQCWMILNQQIIEKFGVSAAFYLKRKFIIRFDNVNDAALHLHISSEKLLSTLNRYNEFVLTNSADEFGKTTFPCIFDVEKPLFIAVITPSIHYTMGGIAFNQKSQAMRMIDGKPIPGLFVAGETTGGLHGANRLGGNSLAECVVFGRIAGRNAANHFASNSLSPLLYTQISFIKRVELSSSTSLFQFALSSIDAQAGLGLGEYIALRIPIPDNGNGSGSGGKDGSGGSGSGDDDNRYIVRYYSPVSRPDCKGQIDLLIKTNLEGVMTSHLMNMKFGDMIDCQGPIGGPTFQLGDSKSISMLAGGTGISSMIQIIRSHLHMEFRNSSTNLTFDLRLLYGCKNESEILLRDVLDEHSRLHRSFLLHYVLEDPPEDWSMSRGFITEELIKRMFPPPGETYIFICGSPTFCKVMKQYLHNLGYKPEKDYYSFL